MPQPRKPRRLPLEQSRPKFVGANILPDSNVWCDKHLPAMSDYIVFECLKNHEDTWVKGVNQPRRDLAPKLIGSYSYVDSTKWDRYTKNFRQTKENDRPVAASAKAAGARYIMSFNFKDFHPWEMHEQNLEVYPPDAILSECIYTCPYISRVFSAIADLDRINTGRHCQSYRFFE